MRAAAWKDDVGVAIANGAYMIIFRVPDVGEHKKDEWGVLMENEDLPFATLDADEATNKRNELHKFAENVGIDVSSWMVQR
jgi:hypothetical protein